MDYRKNIQESLDYIENNLKTQITALELSELAGYSLFHYYRLFQTMVGVPVMQYILRRRLIHAIYEIRCGRKRIDVISEYGFATYSGFYQAFQREFNCTPSSFLKKGRAKKPYHPNLFKEQYMNITHKKASKILKFWDLENEPIFDIYREGNGEKIDNAVYVGEDYILKYSANFGKIKNAITLLKAIEASELYTSSLIVTKDGREFIKDSDLFFYVTKRICGNQINPYDFYEDNNMSQSRFFGKNIGQLHIALNQTQALVDDVNLYETVKNWAIPNVKNILSLSEEFCEDFISSFSELYDKLPKQIIHRDPNPSNIIVFQNKWGFVDFELSEKSIRLYDPCYAATAILSETYKENDQSILLKWLDIYKNIILGYDSVAHLTDSERKAIPYVILANQFVCVAWFSTQDKYTEIFEVNKNITKWLLSVFDKLKIF